MAKHYVVISGGMRCVRDDLNLVVTLSSISACGEFFTVSVDLLGSLRAEFGASFIRSTKQPDRFHLVWAGDPLPEEFRDAFFDILGVPLAD